VESGLSTESESHRADVFVGEVEKLVGDLGLEDKQRLEELLRELSVGLRGIGRSLEERRTQWVNRTWEELRQLMCNRSSGLSHAEVGGGAAEELDQWIHDFVR
jgi:hypothetical protein